MAGLLALLVSGLLVVSVTAQGREVVRCGPSQKCPEELPCCSQYGQCGVGAYCLGGCNPLESFSLESCVPAPVCKSQDYKLNSLDGIVPNTEYLGDPSSADWVSSGKPAVFEDSVLLTMPEDSVGTLLASTSYIWYGQVSATLRTSRGRGVVTAFILLSDVKDEIDFEFVGADLTVAQNNYYFQGITNYNNGRNITLTDTFENWHTYTIDWTPDEIKWSVNGQVGRTLKKSDTWNATSNRHDFPQTPSRLQLSLWPGGLPTNEEGTINWAGGLVDWNSPDIQDTRYYYAQVKDVSIKCYDPPSDTKKTGSKAYIYTDEAGTQDTVEITDKSTTLKSLIGTGTNMDAEDPSAKPSKSESATASRSQQTAAASSKSTVDINRQVPGLTGAGTGPGTNGLRDSANAQSSTTDDSGSSESSSGRTSNSASANSEREPFSQGPTQQNGAPRQGESGLQGSVFAGLIAVAGMLLL